MEVGANQSQDQNASDQEERPIASQEPVQFDWQSRWLKGHQYAFILKNIDAYCAKYGFIKFDFKTHPSSIYQNPISIFTSHLDGMIYFVKGEGVGSDFGFPRVAKKKKYRWKKMNFTTDLPKQMPHVTYVVASAMKSQQIQDQQEMPNFRMHAVIPYKDRLKQYSKTPQYILCHVRKVEKKRAEEEQDSLKDCFTHNSIDFYKLFSTLHNLSLLNQKTDNFSL